MNQPTVSMASKMNLDGEAANVETTDNELDAKPL